MSTLCRILLPVFFLLSGLNIAYAQAPAWRWAKGRPVSHAVDKTVADAKGNIYQIGQFEGTAIIGNDTLRQPAGSRGSCLYLARLNANGEDVWARQIANNISWNLSSLALNGQGELLMAGNFSSDTLRLGPFLLRKRLSLDEGFLAVYSLATSTWLYAKETVSTENCPIHAVAMDSTNHIYATGSFMGTATFGSTTLTNLRPGEAELFIAKLDMRTGTWLWAKQSTTQRYGQGIGWDMVLDQSGKLFVSGTIGDSARIGTVQVIDPVSRQNATTSGVLVAQFDTGTGGCDWAIITGGEASNDDGLGIAVDLAGDIYTHGAFFGTATFGSFVLNSAGDPIDMYEDAFLLKIKRMTHEVVWATSFGGIDHEQIQAITLDERGNVLATGTYRSTAFQIGSQQLTTTSGATTGFLARFKSSNGSAEQALSFGGSCLGIVEDLEIDDSGNVYLAGTSGCNSASFGPFQLSNTQSYLAKLHGFAALRIPTYLQPISAENLSIYPNPAHNILQIKGYITGSTISLFDPMGKAVRMSSITKGDEEIQISVNGLLPGLYTLRCGSQSRKVMIE